MTVGVTHDQVVWCAGVIDALGNIRTRPMGTGSELAYVGVSSPRMDILSVLGELTGTTVTTVNREYARVGCDQHCDEPHQHVSSSTGRWSLTGTKALLFLSAVEPYLVTKREEARVVIGLGGLAPSKPAVAKKMIELGWR